MGVDRGVVVPHERSLRLPGGPDAGFGDLIRHHLDLLDDVVARHGTQHTQLVLLGNDVQERRHVGGDHLGQTVLADRNPCLVKRLGNAGLELLGVRYGDGPVEVIGVDLLPVTREAGQQGA